MKIDTLTRHHPFKQKKSPNGWT